MSAAQCERGSAGEEFSEVGRAVSLSFQAVVWAGLGCCSQSVRTCARGCVCAYAVSVLCAFPR